MLTDDFYAGLQKNLLLLLRLLFAAFYDIFCTVFYNAASVAGGAAIGMGTGSLGKSKEYAMLTPWRVRRADAAYVLHRGCFC
jgi:hypothetical protein